MVNEKVLKALTVTAELTNTELSKNAARVMMNDLAPYPIDQVLEALTLVRYECRRGGLTVEAVVSRLPDGRPGPEEAWALVPESEAETVVWTDECNEAWAACLPLLKHGERIPARQTFKERYVALVRQNRLSAKPVTWRVSLGFDMGLRRMALLDAMKRGRLPRQQVVSLLPDIDIDSGQPIKPMALLEAPKMPPKVRQSLTEFLAQQRARSKQIREEQSKQRIEQEAQTFHDPEWCARHGVRYG